MLEQIFKNIDDILWKEEDCASEFDYAERTASILFFNYIGDLEKEWTLPDSYEIRIKSMGDAGGPGGQYCTPRPLKNSIAQLGSLVGFQRRLYEPTGTG